VPGNNMKPYGGLAGIARQQSKSDCFLAVTHDWTMTWTTRRGISDFIRTD